VQRRGSASTQRGGYNALSSESQSTARHSGQRESKADRAPRFPQGRGRGVGRSLGIGFGLGVGVGRIVAVGVAVGVGEGEGGTEAVGVGVGLAGGVGVGVGVPPPPWLGAWISTVVGEPVLNYPTVASAVCGG
jgi:hypothetical protein